MFEKQLLWISLHGETLKFKFPFSKIICKYSHVINFFVFLNNSFLNKWLAHFWRKKYNVISVKIWKIIIRNTNENYHKTLTVNWWLSKVQKCFSRLYHVHLSTSVLIQTVSTCASRGRLLSRFTSVPKIPLRFGKFLVRGRLGPEIRVQDKQTRTSVRSATILRGVHHESLKCPLAFLVPRQVHTQP